ncbi:MAG TPA: SGNH/GDSL hydrolase family protein [Opitutaceae bacterium]|nr:SGNH/GDSL hydrolase family protein [Opitutaceae bacterium]
MRFRSLAVLLTLALAGCATTTRTSSSWTKLFVFGDSYSDSGAGYVDGNGPTAVVYLAQGLGIPFTYATDPNRDHKGLNFAVSGAQTGWGNGRHVKQALLGRGMRNQVQDFVARAKSGEITFDPATTLFFLAGGLNDRKFPTETTISNLEEEMKELYAAGARHFSVALLPTKIRQFADVGKRLDPALAQIPATFHLDGATIQLSLWGEFYDEVMDHAQQYGITNTRDACAGRRIFNQDPTPKGDPATYFFYHEGHPSTAVHRIVGEKMVREMGEK